MAPRLSPRAMAGIVVFVAVVGTLGVVYFTILGPQLKTRRELQYELEKAQKRWAQIQKDFGYNTDPQREIQLLSREVQSLEAAMQSLDKISEARLPSRLYPEDLDTDDVDHLLLRYETRLEDVAGELEDQLKARYRKKRVPFPHDFEFDTSLNVKTKGNKALRDVREKGEGRMALLLVAEDLCDLFLDADIFALRELKFDEATRSNDVWLLRYDVEFEASTQSLVRLAYLMRERTAYYFFEDVTIEPVTQARGTKYFSRAESDFEDMDEMRVTAVIGTIRNQERVASTGTGNRREEARAAAEKRRAEEDARENSAWMQLVRQLEDPNADKSVFGEEKPWWKFW